MTGPWRSSAFARRLAAVLALGLSLACAAADLQGSGATFPYPLYARWIADYGAAGGERIDYRPTGSGEGIEAIEQRRVDFAGTDMPLPPDELARHRLMQFPLTIGGVVPVINVQGIAPGALKLTGEVLAGIYLGRIRRWNEAPIAELNPDLSLPNVYITVVHREDSSGSTFLWTRFLAASSPEWKARVGSGPKVAWPVGVGGRGNEGVASLVQRTRMSLGYVEYAYAVAHRLSHVTLRNRAGAWVLPSETSFAAATEGVDWRAAEGFAQLPVDGTNLGAWPLTGASFILMAAGGARNPQALRFFDWALGQGATASTLGYSALPPALAKQVRDAWAPPH